MRNVRNSEGSARGPELFGEEESGHPVVINDLILAKTIWLEPSSRLPVFLEYNAAFYGMMNNDLEVPS